MPGNVGTVKWTWKYYKINGPVYANQSGNIPVSIPMSSGKSSNDVGVFTPGIYRVNPYQVFRNGYEIGGNSLHARTQNGTIVQEATVSGDLAIYFADRARQVSQYATLTSPTNHADRVLVRALGKLGEKSVGLGENLGELKETLDLLRHPFKSFREFFTNNDLRNLGLFQRLNHFDLTGKWVEKGGRSLSGRKAAEVAAQSWLEYRYGLMPLVYTVQDILKMVHKAAEKLDSNRIQTVAGNIVGVQDSPKPTISNTFGALLGHNEFACEVRVEDTRDFRARVQYQLLGLPGLMDSLGLSLRHVPELVYELTRLSFVMDWWFDIGSWLATLRFNPQVRKLGNTVGTKLNRRAYCTGKMAVSYEGMANSVSVGILGVYTHDQYDRQTHVEPPTTPLFLPEFRSVNHTIDALALLLKPTLALISKVK